MNRLNVFRREVEDYYKTVETPSLKHLTVGNLHIMIGVVFLIVLENISVKTFSFVTLKDYDYSKSISLLSRQCTLCQQCGCCV